MLQIRLPDGREYNFHTAVFDYNGTIAADGVVANEVKRLLVALAGHLRVVVLTADTFGRAADQLHYLPVELVILGEGEGGAAKAAFITAAGADGVVAIGNGVNDRAMFETAALAIGIIGPEGASLPTLLAADLVVPGPAEAIGLLLTPKRLVATLRP